MVLLNQTGLQHSVLFLDSRLPFLSCKKYSSASGWQAISFYKCVRPRFFYFFLSLSPFLLLCPAVYVSFWGKGMWGNKGADFNSCIWFFSIHRSLASHGSFICTRLLTQLCLLSAMGELLPCIGLGAREGAEGLCCQAAASAAPKFPDVVVLLINSFIYGFWVLVRYKIASWRSYWRSPYNNLYRSADF